MEVIKETDKEIVFEKHPSGVLLKVISLIVVIVLLIWLIGLEDITSFYLLFGLTIFFLLLLILTVIKTNDKVIISGIDRTIKRNKKLIANFNEIEVISLERYLEEGSSEECYELEIIFKTKPSLELASNADIRLYEIAQRIAALTKKEINVSKKAFW